MSELEHCPKCSELVQPRKIFDKDMVYVYCTKCQALIREYKNEWVK